MSAYHFQWLPFALVLWSRNDHPGRRATTNRALAGSSAACKSLNAWPFRIAALLASRLLVKST
jgi:hypothetical protein